MVMSSINGHICYVYYTVLLETNLFYSNYVSQLVISNKVAN